jgi:hypothetical protein
MLGEQLVSLTRRPKTRRFAAELGFWSLFLWNSSTLPSEHPESRAAFSKYQADGG